MTMTVVCACVYVCEVTTMWTASCVSHPTRPHLYRGRRHKTHVTTWNKVMYFLWKTKTAWRPSMYEASPVNASTNSTNMFAVFSVNLTKRNRVNELTLSN